MTASSILKDFLFKFLLFTTWQIEQSLVQQLELLIHTCRFQIFMNRGKVTCVSADTLVTSLVPRTFVATTRIRTWDILCTVRSADH